MPRRREGPRRDGATGFALKKIDKSQIFLSWQPD